jgi:hypothetical protein
MTEKKSLKYYHNGTEFVIYFNVMGDRNTE